MTFTVSFSVRPWKSSCGAGLALLHERSPSVSNRGAQFRWKLRSKSLEIPLGIKVFPYSWLTVTIGGKYHTFTIGGMQAE